MKSFWKRLAFSAAAAAIMSPAAAYAQDAVYQFNIPAQDLGAALRAFGQQSGQQMAFDARVVRGKQSTALAGGYSADEGLRRLLDGTGLRFSRSPAGVLVVDHPASPTRLGVSTSEPTTDEAIVVTGTNIRGLSNNPSPVQVLNGEDLQQRGYTSVERVFEDLPQNFSGVSSDGSFNIEGGSGIATANIDYASGVDLRGLGVGSTLTLVNGVRRAGSVDGRVVDISTIPLSVIDRIEIVSGGRSAVYGSDAVAGVVNFVTRRSFEGVELQAGYSSPTSKAGGARYQASLTTGAELGNAGFIAAYDFTHEEAFDMVQAGQTGAINALGRRPLRLEATPEVTRQSVFFSGFVDVTPAVQLFVDGLYANKDLLNTRAFQAPTFLLFEPFQAQSQQYSVAAGARIDLPHDWLMTFSGTRSSNEIQRYLDSRRFAGTTVIRSSVSNWSKDNEFSSFSAVATGVLPLAGDVSPHVAIGVEARTETFDSYDTNSLSINGGPPSFSATTDSQERDVRSIFGEAVFPLGSRLNQQLDLSLAGRYDDYSDFGSTFNPQIGVVWRPSDEVQFRAAYSEAFRAPSLFELGTNTFVTLFNRTDASTGGVTPVLERGGDNTGLGPEEAKTWSTTLDWDPSDLEWLSLSLTYFQAEYENRIDTPALGANAALVLANENRYPGLIDRSPSAAELAAIVAARSNPTIDNFTGTPFNPNTQDLLTVFPNLVVFDNRTNNVAVELVRAIDFTGRTQFDVGPGELSFGLNISYTLEHERGVTSTSPTIELINSVGLPPDLRMRGTVDWSQGPISAAAAVNYTDGYANPISSVQRKIDSWTTVDLSLSFDSSESDDGIRVTFSAQNVFDEAPPVYQGNILAVLYDTANANPFGRILGVRIAQRW